MGIGSDATVPTKRRVVREKKKLRVVKSMVGWSKVLQSIGLYAKWCVSVQPVTVRKESHLARIYESYKEG